MNKVPMRAVVAALVVDKAKPFADALGAAGTDAEERLFALKFLLHLVGDMERTR